MKFLYVFTFLSTATITLNICQAETISPPPQCDPNLIEEAPYQLRKVCAALSTIYQLSSAMESYIEEKAPRQLQYLRAAGNGNERFDNSVKRQDLDHVFLRFGRRRR